MAVSLDDTVGGSASNSYVDVADAAAYLEERLYTAAWDAATADEKAQALIQATRRLDQETYQGDPVNPLTGTYDGTTQALKFPRYNVIDTEGNVYEEDVIPEPMRQATCKLALHYLNQSSDPLANFGLEPFEEVSLGPIKVKPRYEYLAAELPEDVQREIRHLLAIGAGSSRYQFTIERA